MAVSNALTSMQAIELESCVRCGCCAYACPVFQETKSTWDVPSWKLKALRHILSKENSLATILSLARSLKPEMLEKYSQQTYANCTLCGRCMPGCVFGIQNREFFEILRFSLYQYGYAPDPLKKIATSLAEKRNVFNSEEHSHLTWIDKTGFKDAPIEKKVETVYFIGCATASVHLNQGIAYATGAILNKVKESWTLLGDGEWCCGNPWIAIGDQKKAWEFALHNVDLIESLGAKKVVTTCSGCYQMLKWRYPQILGRPLRFGVFHITELLEDCIADTRIQVYEKVGKKVTYHDPCQLSRLGGVEEQPRRVLRYVSKHFVEMPENRIDTYCCGGGGLLRHVNDALGLKIGTTRVKHAKEVGAEILTSACPMCKMTLSDAAKKVWGTEIEVLDIVELVARQMGLSHLGE